MPPVERGVARKTTGQADPGIAVFRCQGCEIGPGIKSLAPCRICIQIRLMSHTISVRIPDSTKQRLEARVRQAGRSRSVIVKEALEHSLASETRAFMHLAGSLDGAPDLSTRKGLCQAVKGSRIRVFSWLF